MRPVVVTGASGFLGGRLAQTLVLRGERVRVLARPTSDLSHLDLSTVEVHRGALDDPGSLDGLLDDAGVVYHCAALSTDWGPPAAFRAANADGVGHLLARARAARLDRFVHVSSTDVYGYPRIAVDESAALVDVGLPYNRTKIAGERAVWEAIRAGLPGTIVRPASIYGPRSKDLVAAVVAAIRADQMVVVDGGHRPAGLVYVDNAVDAMVRLAGHPGALGRAYNLRDPDPLSWRGYLDRLAAGLGLVRRWRSLPHWLAYTVGGAAELGRRAVGSWQRPLLTRHAVLLMSRPQDFSIDRLQGELAWQPPVSLDQAIDATVRWAAGVSA